MSSEEGEKVRCDMPCDSAHVSGLNHSLVFVSKLVTQMHGSSSKGIIYFKSY